MRVDRLAQMLWIVPWAGIVVAGCNRDRDSSTAKETNANATSPAGRRRNDERAADHAPTTESTVTSAESTSLNSASVPSIQHGTTIHGRDRAVLALDGLVMEIPTGWVAQPVSGAGPMAPKAVLDIPNKDGEPGSVRITHFPRMRGMNEQNVQRWIAQARKPDGSPMSQADAKISSNDLGKVKLTTVDLTGTIKATMRAAAKPNQRMMATIIDHSQGPHFVVAGGEVDLMNRCQPDILAFLKSAREIPP